MVNVVRELRTRLGLGRKEFGVLIGKSPESVERYETELTKDVRVKLRDVALERGLTEIAERINRDLEGTGFKENSEVVPSKNENKVPLEPVPEESIPAVEDHLLQIVAIAIQPFITGAHGEQQRTPYSSRPIQHQPRMAKNVQRKPA